ncbi:MAG: UDP-N-acetylmuramoyl-L-alanine--D-glutamate ligase [bacterium]|nr:UDP-N-acetylmuramoyl-L-alanine--D-glutamate ligase [bacterium]
MLNLKNKKVTVLGLGVSGLASAKLLYAAGAKVTVWDELEKERLFSKISQLPDGVKVICGEPIDISGSNLIVASPGIPPDLQPMLLAEKKGIPVISELELGYQYLSGQKLIALTGTNGKTTTVSLIGKILSGRPVKVCGNIGLPLCEVIPDTLEKDIICLEVSSFQLEKIIEFRPDIAAFLNFAPDHLDRYLRIEDYIKAKARIFENQKKEDVMVLNADDYVVVNLGRKGKAKPYFFSKKQILQEGIFVRGEYIVARFKGKEERIIKTDDFQLKGQHNLENVLCAILCGIVVGIDIDIIVEEVRNFKPLPHRIELIAVISSIRFINDSKATNVASVIAALVSFNKPIILIAGGKDKGEDYSMLIPYLKERCKALILFGEAADIIGSMVRDAIGVSKVSDLAQAVNLAYALAETDDIVLLSPACSSFDQFTSYKERGEVFKKEVIKMKERLHGKESNHIYSS